MNAIKPPGWFWVVSVLGLLWNLVGLSMFYMQMAMTPEAAAALPPEQQQIHAAMPTVAYAFFGIAVIAGVLGSLGLLLRRRWAAPLLLRLARFPLEVDQQPRFRCAQHLTQVQIAVHALHGDLGGLQLAEPLLETALATHAGTLGASAGCVGYPLGPQGLRREVPRILECSDYGVQEPAALSTDPKCTGVDSIQLRPAQR